jgi:hypothetical protein
MTLFASLSSEDRLESLNLPADDRPQRDGLVLLAVWHNLLSLYDPFANAKLTGMPINPAATPESKMPINVGVSPDFSGKKTGSKSVSRSYDGLDRRSAKILADQALTEPLKCLSPLRHL